MATIRMHISIFIMIVMMNSWVPIFAQNENSYTVIKSCIAQAQRISLLQWQAKPKFARCTSFEDEPQMITKNTITIEETESVSESIMNVSNCFSIPYQSIFAKFYGESGFQQNIMGPSKDTGIGQLTSSAILDVQNNSEKIWRKIQTSDSPFCKKLNNDIKHFGVQKFFVFPTKQKCQVIHGHFGILRNVFFAFALHQLNESYVKKSFAEFKIQEKLIAAGFENPPIEKLMRMLILLSYNNGGRSSVKDLNSFLESRIDFINRKKIELISTDQFSSEKISQFLGLVSSDDFNFKIGAEKFNQFIQNMAIKFPNQIMNQEFQSIYLRNISASELGFPEWLRIWQSNGGPGYMSGIYLKSKELKNSGLSKCVDDDIFSL